MDVLLQIQADQLRIPVARSAVVETTARGAAWLAGLAEGVWGSLDELAGTWRADVEVGPKSEEADAGHLHAGWLRAVDRARSWAGR